MLTHDQKSYIREQAKRIPEGHRYGFVRWLIRIYNAGA